LTFKVQQYRLTDPRVDSGFLDICWAWRFQRFLCHWNSSRHWNQDDSVRFRTRISKKHVPESDSQVESVHYSPVHTYGKLKSRLLQVFDLSMSRQLVDAAMHIAGLMGKETWRCSLTICSQAQAENSLNFSRHIIDSVPTQKLPLFASIDEAVLDISMIPLREYAFTGAPVPSVCRKQGRGRGHASQPRSLPFERSPVLCAKSA